MLGQVLLLSSDSFAYMQMKDERKRGKQGKEQKNRSAMWDRIESMKILKIWMFLWIMNMKVKTGLN